MVKGIPANPGNFVALQLNLYLEHCAGLFIEVHSGDHTSRVFLHIKNAGTVGKLDNIHLVANPTRWGALQGKKRQIGDFWGFVHFLKD